MATQHPKVALVMPHIGPIKGRAVQSWIESTPPHNSRLFRIPNKPVDVARNEGAEKALEWGAKIILMIDADMTFVPGTTQSVVQRVQGGLDVVSGMIFRRLFPTRPAWGQFKEMDGDSYLYTFDDESVMETIEKYGIDRSWDNEFILPRDDADLWPVEGVGAAFMAINAEVFSKIEEPWFKGVNRKGSGEDFFFCRRLKAAGLDIYVDRGIGVGHLFTEEMSIGISDYHWTMAMMAMMDDDTLEIEAAFAPE